MNNNKVLLAVLLGLIIGIGIGFLICSGMNKDRGPGNPPPGGGPTPSQMAQGLASGTWSNVACGSDMAHEILTEIQGMAVGALGQGNLTPEDFIRLNNCLLECAVNVQPFSGTVQEHCQKLGMARGFAEEGKWDLCYEQMEHEH